MIGGGADAFIEDRSAAAYRIAGFIRSGRCSESVYRVVGNQDAVAVAVQRPQQVDLAGGASINYKVCWIGNP